MTLQSPLSEPDNKELYFKGKSMRGVFLPGDRLHIEASEIQELSEGDIIVFEKGKQDIVHRIVQHQGTQLITWGDSNPVADKEAVFPVNLKGKVIGFNRKGREKKVYNGPLGLREWKRHQFLWQLIFRFDRLLSRFIRPSSLTWLFRIEPVVLKLENNPVNKIVYKGKTIGSFDPLNGSYHVRKPWSFFVSRRFVRERLKGHGNTLNPYQKDRST